MATTIAAMNRVLEIRQKRQKQFIKNRLLHGKQHEKVQALQEITRNIELVAAPQAVERRAEIQRLVKSQEKKMELN